VTAQQLDAVERLAASQGLGVLGVRATDHLRWLGHWVDAMQLESTRQTGLGIR
jgi:hypothetical protein